MVLLHVVIVSEGKRFFCVLVCCMGSTVYLAGRHLKNGVAIATG